MQSLVNLMEDSWINPFRLGQHSLVNPITAALAEVANDLMNTSKIVEDAYEVTEWILCHNKYTETEDISDYAKKVACKLQMKGDGT